MAPIVTPYNKSTGKKEQVAEMFDNIAPKYDRLNRTLAFNIDQRWRKKCVRVLQGIAPKEILDVATGTADLAIACLDLKPEKVVGIDISEKMLAFGKEKIEKLGLNNKIELLYADSEALPFDDGSFDAVTCGFGIRNFSNLEKGLSEIARVIRPGGKASILEFSKPRNFIFKQIYYFYFFHVLPMIGRIVSGDNRAYTYLPESVKHFPDGDELAAILKQCGFNHVQCKKQLLGVCTIYIASK